MLRRRSQPPDIDTIKQSIPILAAIERYGFESNRAGFICCPFHNEDTPSLKIYSESDSWHCFGCGEGGDIVDFVRKLFNLSLSAALVRIRSDFGISDTGGCGRTVGEQIRTARAEAARKKQEQERAFFELCDQKSQLEQAIKVRATTHERAQQQAARMARLAYLEYFLESGVN